MYDISVKIKNYKCFKDETGFNDIQRVNLIIGRNNAGKSSLLDVIETLTKGCYDFDPSSWREGQPPQIIFKSKITEDLANKTFPSHLNGDAFGSTFSGNHRVLGQQYVGRELTWSRRAPGQNQGVFIMCDDKGIDLPLNLFGPYSQNIANNVLNPFEEKTFRRVSAERDIFPEADNAGAIDIKANGTGITNAIQCFINRSNLPSKVVEEEILNALNTIFAHDAIYTDIVCQMHNNSTWEIYLEEEHKGRIALSKSGSGIKTVITVLVSLHLIPSLDKKSLSNYIFGFEELENNIHPALLRRLNDYIYKLSLEKDFIYFLTTHSNVLIDQFSKQIDAQIIHVKQSESISECLTARTYVANNGILDDLDVRASDLLQANGVIWVEGPSDRAYLNRWINLWSNGQLKEGTHYQIIFYGGRLLSHLSVEEPETGADGICILSTNRNAIIMIDSDKKTPNEEINAAKKRIKLEIEKLDGLCWITQGKEIENYIPIDVVNKFLGTTNERGVEQFDSFFDHMDTLKQEEGQKYSKKKPLLAEKLIEYMTHENMIAVLDMDEKMKDVCHRITCWNS